MPHRCTNCGRTFADGSKEMLSGCPDCGGNKFQFAPKGSIGGGTESAAGGSTGSEAAGSTPSDARNAGSDASSGARSDSSDGAVSRAAETVRGWVSDRSNSSDVATGSSSRGDGFDEWPDSARRPSDRSGPADERSPSGGPGPRSRPDTPSESEQSSNPNAPGGSTPGGNDFVDEREQEDAAQADARSELVSGDELPPRSSGPDEPDVPAADEGETSDAAADAPDHGRVVSEPDDDERPSLEDLRAELNDQFESIKILEPGQYELNLMELYDREEYIVSLQEDGRYVIDVPDSWRDGDDEGP